MFSFISINYRFGNVNFVLSAHAETYAGLFRRLNIALALYSFAFVQDAPYGWKAARRRMSKSLSECNIIVYLQETVMAFQNFTKILQFDFQINRILTYGSEACDVDEVVEASKKISDFDTWFQVWYSLGKNAEQDARFLHAAYYYRLSEFFLHDKDPFKIITYKMSVNNFNKVIVKDALVKTVFVPYMNSEMKTLIFTASAEIGKLVIFGGYDSFIEEFYLAIKEIVKSGYTVYLFEGPGQGSTLKNGIVFEHKWEKPLGAILDYFNLENVTIIGISWGGVFSITCCGI